MANTSPKPDPRTTSCKINEIPSRQGDDSSSLSSISNNCLNNNDEDQVISNETGVANTDIDKQSNITHDTNASVE